jgi:16S rRNA (cytidine1402-2'-O)-methyltransferase
LESLKARDGVKGEITLIIAKPEASHAGGAAEAPDRRSVRQRVAQIMAEEKIDEKAALKKVAKERGISKSEAYREMQRTK